MGVLEHPEHPPGYAPDAVDCGSPPLPTNGAIISQSSTLEGSRITFTCDDGFSPSLAIDAEFQPDGNWQPDPAGVVCTAEASLSSQLLNRVTLAIVAVICSIQFSLYLGQCLEVCVCTVSLNANNYTIANMVVNFLYHNNQLQIMKMFITQDIH